MALFEPASIDITVGGGEGMNADMVISQEGRISIVYDAGQYAGQDLPEVLDGS